MESIYDRLYEICMDDDKYPVMAENAARVVEDVAIKFAEYLLSGYNQYYSIQGNYWTLKGESQWNRHNWIITKELFELFKKENNL